MLGKVTKLKPFAALLLKVSPPSLNFYACWIILSLLKTSPYCLLLKWVLPWWFRRQSNAGDPGSILGSGRSLGEGNGNPLQYSCLESPMHRGAW